MNSKIFRLNYNDFLKGGISAILAAAIITLYGFVSQTDFNLFSADWGVILSKAINAAVAAFVGYMSKNLLSDESGRVLGKIG